MALNYAPEVVGIGPYNTQLAEHLVGRCHHVTVLTSFPYYPHWEIMPRYRGLSPFMVEQVNGVRVLRCPLILPPQKPTTLRRILFDSSLALTTLIASAAVGPVDLVVCVSPSLQLGVTAWLIAQATQAQFHLHIQDIVPDAAIGVGMMSEGRMVRLARHLENFVYSRASRISVISDGFYDNLIAKSVPATKLLVLPNWIDTAQLGAPPDQRVRSGLGASDGETLVMHTGNMGAKQGLETIIKAAAELSRESFAVALIGDGNYRLQLEARARSLNVPNLKFLPLQSDYPATLAAADILLVSQRGQVIDSVAPSKLLSYMASGRPIVAAVNARSEAARLIRDALCGVVVPAEDALALAGAIRELRGMPERRQSLGRAGRQYAADHFEKARVLQRWSELIEGAAAHPR